MLLKTDNENLIFLMTFIYNVSEILWYRDLSIIYFHCIIWDILMLKQAIIWTAGYRDTWILYMPPDQHELTHWPLGDLNELLDKVFLS